MKHHNLHKLFKYAQRTFPEYSLKKQTKLANIKNKAELLSDIQEKCQFTDEFMEKNKGGIYEQFLLYLP